MLPVVTPEDYNTVFWPQLQGAIDTVLQEPPGSYKPISYEQMYSAVYKCVCKQHSERLYGDLMRHIEAALRTWCDRLEAVRSTDNNQLQFVHEFDRLLAQYLHALASIVPIFTYMNRFYVESKLNTDLRVELLRLFSRQVADKYVQGIIGLLGEAQQNPFSLSPAVVHNLLGNLHSLNGQYAQINPGLFARHLVGIHAPMSEDELEAQQEADRHLQAQLRQSGFNSGNQSRKRSNSDFEQAQLAHSKT